MQTVMHIFVGWFVISLSSVAVYVALIYLFGVGPEVEPPTQDPLPYDFKNL